MQTGFILNKEESCLCLRAYGQRKCCVLMFVQNLEGTELSCFKIKAQKPNKDRNVGHSYTCWPPCQLPAAGGRCAGPGGLREQGGRASHSLPATHVLPPVCPLPLASSPQQGWRPQETATAHQRPAVQNLPWRWPRVSGREIPFSEGSSPGVSRQHLSLWRAPISVPGQGGLGKGRLHFSSSRAARRAEKLRSGMHLGVRRYGRPWTQSAPHAAPGSARSQAGLWIPGGRAGAEGRAHPSLTHT